MFKKEYGAINEVGEEVIPCKYEYIELFCFDNNNFAIVEIGERFGVINEFGDEIIPLQYDSISVFDNGIVRVDKDEVCGAMNMNGYDILPFEYDWIIAVKKDRINSSTGLYEVRYFDQNIIARRNDKYGLYDENGNEIFPCIYNSFDEVDEKGYFVAYLEENNESPVLLNISGKEIISKGYEYIGTFGDDDLIPVSKQGQCSYLDRKGNDKMQLSDKYVRAGKFVRIHE